MNWLSVNTTTRSKISSWGRWGWWNDCTVWWKSLANGKDWIEFWNTLLVNQYVQYLSGQNTQIVKIRKRPIYLNGPMDKKVKNLKFSSSRHCWNKMLCCRIGRSASSLWNYRWRRYWIGSWRTRRKITASLFAHSNLKWPKNIFYLKNI